MTSVRLCEYESGWLRCKAESMGEKSSCNILRGDQGQYLVEVEPQVALLQYGVQALITPNSLMK